MRLLNAQTRQLEEFISEPYPPYAILSHTWGNDEVSFNNLRNDCNVEDKEGYYKIRCTCNQALEDGLYYAWVDTCCIDKSSSAELSESINSMWRWYRGAARCYAFLSDIPGEHLEPSYSNIDEESDPRAFMLERNFRECRWFTRGWTLQELLAPPRVTFYGKGWGKIGTRNGNLRDLICDITKIPLPVIERPQIVTRMSIAQRMSWAACRKTSRPEDEAYSLLGIFNVNMPMLYGEGRKAFIRLQEEIIKMSTDHSIFAWRGVNRPSALLADSPAAFIDCGNITAAFDDYPTEPYEMTNRGLRITLPLDSEEREATLNCRQGPYGLILNLRNTWVPQEGQAAEYTTTPYTHDRISEFLGDRVNTIKRIIIIRRERFLT